MNRRFSASLQHQGFQIAVVDGGGKDDLGAGGTQLLELEDQMLQLGHTAAADLDEECIIARDVVALQHFLAVLDQVQERLVLGGGHRKADEGIHIHAVCRAVECDGIAADDAIGLQLVDAAGNGRAGQSTCSAISLTGIRAFLANRARILRSKSSMGQCLL